MRIVPAAIERVWIRFDRFSPLMRIRADFRASGGAPVAPRSDRPRIRPAAIAMRSRLQEEGESAASQRESASAAWKTGGKPERLKKRRPDDEPR